MIRILSDYCVNLLNSYRHRPSSIICDYLSLPGVNPICLTKQTIILLQNVIILNKILFVNVPKKKRYRHVYHKNLKYILIVTTLMS